MSKLNPVWHGHIIDDDKLVLDKEDLFNMFKTKLKRPNEKKTKVVLTLKRFYRSRSPKANSYYWVCMTYLGNELGYEPEELHSTFKAMFLTDKTGKLPIVRSTTSLSSVAFMDYISKIGRKVGEIGLELPNPDDYYTL